MNALQQFIVGSGYLASPPTHLVGPVRGGSAEEVEGIHQVPLRGLDHSQTVGLVLLSLK